MPTLYRKTAKGLSEIETRENRLPPRVRSALILVDGKRSLETLRGLIGAQADETLGQLLEQGFIALVDRPASVATVDIPLAPAPAPAAAAPTQAPPAQETISAADFESTRRAAVRELNVVLGPMGETLAIRMEKARDAAELRPVLVLAAQVIANARGRAAAEAYASRFTV